MQNYATLRKAAWKKINAHRAEKARVAETQQLVEDHAIVGNFTNARALMEFLTGTKNAAK